MKKQITVLIYEGSVEAVYGRGTDKDILVEVIDFNKDIGSAKELDKREEEFSSMDRIPYVVDHCIPESKEE